MPESLLFQRCTLVSGRTILYCRKSTKTKLVDFQTPTADLRASVIGGLYALKGDHLIEVLVDQYQYLFTPIRVGQTTIPNRIVFAAHLTNLAENNLPGPLLIAYYAERAKGGC
jgi:hypothetical protein